MHNLQQMYALWDGPYAMALGCYLKDCHCEEKQSTLPLVNEQQVDQILDQINKLKSGQLPDAALKRTIMEYTLKEIYFRNAFTDDAKTAQYHIDIGPAMALDEEKFTHEMWINRLVELLDIRDERQPKASAKVQKLLDEGIFAVIGAVPSQGPSIVKLALPTQQLINGIQIMHSKQCSASAQPLCKQLKFDYNKIDDQGNTALDKLIRDINTSLARLKLFQLLTQRQAKLASTTPVDLEKFHHAIKEKHPVYVSSC